jgi:hypothetical protein
VAQQADSSLEGRVAELEGQVRSMRAGGVLGGTAVVGKDPATFQINGPANAAGITAWNVEQGPWVDMLVTGGRVRVEYGSAMFAQTGAAYMCYEVLGPVDREPEPVLSAPIPLFLPPPFDASAFIYSTAGTTVGVNAGFSNFDVVEDMPEGWYRFLSTYAYRYLVNASGGYAYWEYRRIAVTRF